MKKLTKRFLRVPQRKEISFFSDRVRVHAWRIADLRSLGRRVGARRRQRPEIAVKADLVERLEQGASIRLDDLFELLDALDLELYLAERKP